MSRPSLLELAARHAELRWSRKKRNADLRINGYDPDGPDGTVYRQHFERECQAQRMAEFAAETAQAASVTYLWDVPAAEWPAWTDSVREDLPIESYRRRLGVVQRQIEANGGIVVMVPATVADVLAMVAELGMGNNPAGRAAAIGVIGARAK